MKVLSVGYHAAVVAACVALGACASTPPVRYAGLESSSQLQSNTNDRSGRVPYDYSSHVDWSRYSNAVVEPVVIYRGQDAQFGKVSEQNKQELANYMRAQFSEALGSRFNLVNRPGERTVRVQLTLTGATTTKQFIGTVTKFDFVGGPYNIIQSVRGKEGALSGSVSYAVEIYDASTDRLLSAYVAKEYPNAMNVKATLGALGASKVGIKKGAQDLLARLN
jgi:Protein of unknown function (DUF3313).